MSPFQILQVLHDYSYCNNMPLSKPPTHDAIRAKIEDKRKARKEATHLALQEAAERIAIESGRSALTTKALVKEAGVSERTIFNHFANIDRVLLSCLSTRLSELFTVENFPLGLSAQELPAACSDFLLGMIESPQTDRALEQFVQLAATFMDGEDLEETIGKEILETLAQQAWLLCDFIEKNYPELSYDQWFSLAVYINNAVMGIAMGLARYVHYRGEGNLTAPTVVSTSEIKENIVFAIKKVGEGLPVL